MQGRKQISFWKQVTSRFRHHRTYILEWQNLKCLSGYFSYAAEILLSMLSSDCLDSDIIAIRLWPKTLWCKILSQSGKSWECVLRCSCASRNKWMQQLKSLTLRVQTDERVHLLLIWCSFTGLSVLLLYSKRQHEPVLKSLPTRWCKGAS